MPKISITKPELRELLAGIECPSHYKYAAHNDLDNGYFEFVVEQVINSGRASTIKEAVIYLIEFKKQAARSGKKVFLADMERQSNNNTLYKKIDVAVGAEKLAKGNDQSRAFGTLGHDTIPKLFSGRFIRFDKKNLVSKYLGKQQSMNFSSELNFESPTSSQPIIEESSYEKSAIKFVDAMHKAWKKVVKGMLANDMFLADSTEYHSLLVMLQKIFSKQVVSGNKNDFEKITALGTRSPQSEYFLFLTMLTWATTVFHYREVGTRVLFKEVRLFPGHYDVSLGRIDAIEVTIIDGVAPTYDQTVTLAQLASRRYDSVGHIVRTLVKVFNTKRIALKVYDWKFCVGDGDNGIGKTLNIIHVESVTNGSLPKHQLQMERYLSSINISYRMVTDDSVESNELWQESDIVISGEVVYFFPDRMPITKQVFLSDEEKRRSFGKIAASYTNGVFRRKFLDVSKIWLKLGLSLWDGKKSTQQQHLQQPTLPGLLEDTTILNGIHRTGEISRFMKDSVQREFIDELNVYELVGHRKKDGKAIYQSHLDTIIDQIRQGNINDGRMINLVRGQHVKCWMHDDGTPSHYINVKKGISKCFSCGIGGHFAPDSIPEHLEGLVAAASKRVRNKSSNNTLGFSISEVHKRAMLYAQKYLNSRFLNSPGAKYIEDVRGLNPEFSWKLGAGYDDGGLIPYLLQMGFLFDELIEFGFINMQPWVRQDSELVMILKEAGLTIDGIRRQIDDEDKEGNPIKVWALPLSVLHHRITYPLDIWDIITSFYGRSIDPNCEKRRVHQKTICKNGVPQGGFNITNAIKQADEDRRRNTNKRGGILVTESPIDVDTFIQCGDVKNVCGIVGTGNDLLNEILASFDGDITVAFDNDKSKIGKEGKENGFAGQKATIRFALYLKEVQFGYRLFNFTAPFAKKHPWYKDINNYWTTMLREYREQGTDIERISIIHNRERVMFESVEEV